MLPNRPLGISLSTLGVLPRRSSGSRTVVVLAFAFLLGFPRLTPAQAIHARPLITQNLDETNLTRLTGNTHPLARPEFDRGPVPASSPIQRILLVLTRSAEQEAALQALLAEQQDKSSANFHKWLTPDQFGEQFGASEQDIQTITAWLASHGFQVATVSKGRGVIEFSGNAGQVQNAFHTTIHKYVVDGAAHWANASDPQVPSALAPAIAGVDSLNNFTRRVLHHVVGVFAKSARTGRLEAVSGAQSANNANPMYTSVCGSNYCNGITPYDFATIYNVLPLWTAATPIDGSGQTIAIVARSNIDLQDVANFRSIFGLPANAPQVILDGPDPGIVQGEDETEADLDVEWSGAVAKGATIKLVVSESTESTDGVDLSAEYIVNNDVAPIMSESFGQCELFMGTAGNQFYNNLWQQAAAEGISVFVSSGDQGSAGCDFFRGRAPQPAQNGLEVNGIASTPYNVAVGGTDFDDFFNPLTYFNLTNNSTTGESAIGYIPETTWNDTCTNEILGNPQIGFSTDSETNCNNGNLVGLVETIGGSGGKSNCTTPNGSNPFGCAGGYAKPAWQIGTGVPSDNKRDLPDVSLFASNGFLNNFYVLCESDAGGGCGFAGNFLGIGGTSASSPAFAGLMALVNQKQSAAQGNPDFILYKLAAQNATSCNSSNKPASTCVFNDVTSGTIATPCSTGTVNCTTSHGGDQYGILSGYSAGTAYDLATGLGSVNASNLVSNWGNVKFTPSSTTLTLNGGNAVNVTHGTPISVGVSVSPTSPQPTGDVSLIATQGANLFGVDTLTLSNGTASGITNMLPGGTSYTVKAHYGGDGTYGGSDSNGVTVTVSPEASQTSLRIVTFDPATGRVTNPNATTFAYGSPYLLRADVTNSSATSCVNTANVTQAYACPTGNVAIVDNGTALNSGGFALNTEGYTEDQAVQLTGGTHNLAANYSGDNSYKTSSGTDAVTVTPAQTTTSILFNPSMQTAVIGIPVYADALTKTQSEGASPSGSYIAYDGKTQVPGQNPVLGFAGSKTQTASCQGQVQIILSPPSGPHTVTVQYSGDMNYSRSTSNSLALNAVYPITMSVSATPNNIIYGKTVTIGVTADTTNPASNVALKPGGSFSFYGTADGNINNPVTITTTQDSNGNWELQASVTFTPGQTEFVSANYSGDSNYEGMQSGDANITVTIPDFSMSGASTSLAVTAGQTATETITITPLTSYTSTVQLSCQPGTLFPGGTCSISPSSVTVSNSTAGTATLTITTLAPSTATSAFVAPIGWRVPNVPPFGRGGWWTLSLLAGLATILVILLPRKRGHSLRAACGFGLVCLLTFAIGCGGGASAINGGSPVPTTTTISVSTTKVAQMAALTFTGRVTSSKVVTGTITFNSSDCFGGGTWFLQNGMAQTTLSGLPVGTCTFAASYPGDANNLASQSGALSIAVTGTTAPLQVIGRTSTLTHSTPVSVTIQ